MGFSEDYSLNYTRLSDGIIRGVVEFMQYFHKSILISCDGGSGVIGEYLVVASTLKQLWYERTTDIKPPLPPHLIFDRDDAQNKSIEEFFRPFTSSSDEVAVTFAISGGTYLLFPTTSCGLSEGNSQALKTPLPPDTNVVVYTGDIPRSLYLPLLHHDSTSVENGGGESGNNNKE